MARRNGKACGGSGVPVALSYARVSTTEQRDEGVSLAAQVSEGRQYLARHSWILGNEFLDVESGRHDDRPQYRQMLDEAARLAGEGRAVRIVCTRLDRLGRNLAEQLRAREELERLGAELHLGQQGGVLPPLTADILGAVAAEESRMLGRRVSAAIGHIKRGGWHPVGRVPYGYRWRPATAEERQQGAPLSVLVLDEHEAPTVREVFRRLAEGEAIRATRRWLDQQPAPQRSSRRLSPWTVNKMTLSLTYIARISPEGGADPGDVGACLALPRARWEPLVSDETWAAARRHILGHRRLARNASGRFLLSGLLHCPLCGRPMSGRTSVRERRYACSGSSRVYRGQGECWQTAEMGQVDRLVLAQVGGVLEALVSTGPVRAALADAWKRLQSGSGDQAAAVARRRARLEAQRSDATRRLGSLAVLLAGSDIDRAGYDAGRQELEATLARLDGETHELPHPVRPAVQKLPPLSQVLAQAGGWCTVLAGGDVGQQRRVLAELLERVVPERVGHGKYRAHITWCAAWAPVVATMRGAVSSEASRDKHVTGGGGLVGPAARSGSHSTDEGGRP